jgi:hypothetical protein
MPKLIALYSIEVKYFDREANAVKLYRMRGLTWAQLRIFRETVFVSGLFVSTVAGASFGDGSIIPPGDITKIYVYLMKEKVSEPTPEELR